MAGLDATAVNRARKPDLIPGYRLDSLLGRGGMGEVHKATQLSLNRTVAVKILSTELAKDPSFVTRFEKEAAALATLSHPNVVNIVDKGHHDSTWYLVMEYIDGPSLREVMRSPLLEPTGALKMVYDICRGIEYAHSRGVIHRDLKPENILFDEQAGGIPKVTDFGLASFIEGDNQNRYNLTETHVSMGTVSYMAPEQRVDARKADHRADIYSLGVILYELLVGEVPMGNFDPPSQRKEGVDPRVDAIVARCLKQDPAERYARVADLLADLEPLAPVTKTTLRPAEMGVAGRLVSRVRKVTKVVVRGAEVLLVLAAVGVLAVSWLRSQQKAPEFVTPGAAVGKELEAREVMTVSGRIDKDGPKRHMTLGDGPDTIPLLTFGRSLTNSEGVLVSAFDPDHPAARFEPDIVDLDGASVTFSAEIEAQPNDQGARAWLDRLAFARAPNAQAAVLLQGSPGRYVAASISRNGEPVSFEWALGERRGVMLGPASPENGRTLLQLSIDEDGLVRAFLGEGDDRRPVAEPLNLGKDWKKHFGGTVRPALGCVEGTCRFKRVRQQVIAPPPPPAPVAAEPVAPRPVAPAKVAPAKAVAKPAPAKATAKQPARKQRKNR